MIKELDTVVLISDVPEYGLKNGDIGTVVLVHREAKGFEVEFVALDGETIAVATLPAEKNPPRPPRRNPARPSGRECPRNPARLFRDSRSRNQAREKFAAFPSRSTRSL